MHQITISNAEVVLIDSALRLLCVAVTIAPEQWRDEDLQKLHALAADISKLRRTQRERAL